MRIINAKLAAALLATTAVGIGAIEIEANIAARAQLKAYLDHHAGVSVAGLFAEPFTGHLMLRGITFGSGSTRVAIGRLSLPLLHQSFGLVSPAVASPFDDDKSDEKEPEETPDKAAPQQAEPAPTPTAPKLPAPTQTASVGAASAENISITDGQRTTRIKRIDMTGTSLTAADISAMIDPKSAEPAEARFKKLTATAVVVPEILIDDATPGSESHTAIKQVLLSGAIAGKIAAGSANGITFVSKQSDANSTGSITAIQASAIDLVQIARVLTTVRSDDATPILPLYDSITVTGMKVTDEKKKSVVSLGTLKETGLKGRPLATDVISGAKARAEKLTDAQQAAAFNDMANSFEIGSIEANDLAVRSTDAADVTTFNLASVTMHDFAKGRIGGFALRALRFDSTQVKFGFGTVDVGPFTFPKPKGLALGDQDPKAMVPALTTIDMGTIDFDVVTPDKDNKAAPPTRVQFKIGHTGLANDGQPGEIPKSSKVTVDNLSFDIPPNSGQAQALVDMGYSHLDVSASLATTYDADGQELKIDNLMLNGTNMGSLGLGVHLVNVNKGIVSSNAEVAKASALAMLIKGLSLNVVDIGLFDRVLAWKAKQDGKTVDEERKAAIDLFETQLPAMANNNANAKLVGTTIAKFIAAPKNLHIAITSKNGLGAASMGMLADPSLLLDTLDVKATAND